MSIKKQIGLSYIDCLFNIQALFDLKKKTTYKKIDYLQRIVMEIKKDYRDKFCIF